MKYEHFCTACQILFSSLIICFYFHDSQQSVQKVLDVRFHPEGLAQLVCSSNEVNSFVVSMRSYSSLLFSFATGLLNIGTRQDV